VLFRSRGIAFLRDLGPRGAGGPLRVLFHVADDVQDPSHGGVDQDFALRTVAHDTRGYRRWGGRARMLRNLAPITSHVHAADTCRRPAPPMRRARSGSPSMPTTAAASPARSLPPTTIPVSPSTTVSGAPPESPAMTGTPQACASRYTMPRPST